MEGGLLPICFKIEVSLNKQRDQQRVIPDYEKKKCPGIFSTSSSRSVMPDLIDPLELKKLLEDHERHG